MSESESEREIGHRKFCEKMEENQVESEAPKERRRLVLKPRSKDAGKVGGYSKTSSSKSVRIFTLTKFIQHLCTLT